MTQIFQITEISEKIFFLYSITTSCSKLLQNVKLETRTKRTQTHTHKQMHSYFIRKNGHLRWVKEPEPVSLKTYLASMKLTIN